ncbi:MAG: ParB N-terminal domain-containing protein [Candidatus Nitrosocaldus sp.]|nr:ParB N-terminal domain-containing protein [Candidatus Nitrosocaldus sp.]MDW8275469.1 ParB N-terminal domain-containing protein [Candidatus Nitrosocaldus sp.]
MLIDVEIERLKSVDRIVTISTQPMIRSMAESLRRGISSIQPIMVGEVGGEYYILDGYARVQACRLADVKSIKAYVVQLASREDAQRWHIRLNIRSTLNILKLYEAIRNDIHGSGEVEVCSRYGMDVTMVRLLKRLERIKGRAYAKICTYMSSITTRFNRVPPIPYYIIVLISELEDEELQEKAVDFAFINVDDREDVFSFQDYDRMLAFIKMLKSSHRRAEAVKGYAHADGVMGKRRVRDKGRDKSREGNLLHLRCSCGASYVIDAMMHSISKIEERDDLIILKDIESRRLHVVPDEVIQALELDENDVRWYVTDRSGVNSLIESLNPTRIALLAVVC